MHIFKLLAPAALALSMLCVPAFAASDPAHFLITPAFMKKMEAAKADMKGVQKNIRDDDDDDDDSEQTIESAIAKIEKDPQARAMLAKHGLTSREVALASFAMLHAGMYVAMEKSMDKAKAAQAYAGYTKEQKANIELMRTYAAQARK